MKVSLTKTAPTVARLAIFALVLSAFAAMPLLSKAHPQSPSITVVNNSSWEIRYLYLSAVNDDNWSADQMNGATLSPGGSFTISNVSCSGSQIKVVSEDVDGCFLSQVVDCSSNAEWTITNNARPNCGSE